MAWLRLTILLSTAIAYAQSQAAIPGVISARASVEMVKSGFTFTEGPLEDPAGGIVFADIPAGKIYRLDARGRLSTIRENSRGANGLAYSRSGDLYAAEGQGKRISRGNLTGNVTTVVDQFNGRPLGEPNDLIVDSEGGIYFTDPGGQPINDLKRRGAVYYLKPDGKDLIRIDDAMTFPNGLTLSLDGKTLLVNETLGAEIYAWDLEPGGRAHNKRLFTTIPVLSELPEVPGVKVSGADGMCLDQQARVYVTTGTGVQVFDKAGKFLGTIKTPMQPSNCAFAGPDKKMLYITTREAIYRVAVETPGVKRLGK